ncbi:MAG TPA: plastocyanin/azurin family copper-binding protein [Ktedonobacteraceae bacterium]|nr:plastocyanin/azurin family copper-binding protein [Ktedonobacteraceae bacterium]
MSKKRFGAIATLLALFALSSILLVACTRPGSQPAGTANNGGSGSGASSSSGGTEVHLSATNFAQATITIKKGQKVTLVDDGPYTHIIANGTWSNGAQKLDKETGAPTIANVNISSGSTDIGPFTTAGTFHVLCTIHPNMNLDVTVQ